ncbi:MAG: radical SAM protein, partial [Candidatus Caldatribacteriaceae bacterium]
LIEVNRGCAYRCRFCAGSSLYAPLRQRSRQLVQKMVENVFEWTERIGLVGSDVLSYPYLKELIDYLVKSGKEITCSSLSGRRLMEDASLLSLLRKGGLRTLTIAPESGSSQLRSFLGKGFQNEDWRELIRQAVKAGFDRVKLYFMLGKPGGGVEEDLEFLSALTLAVPPFKITVSYSFLVPKPHTALQDFVPPPLSVWKRERALFEGTLRKLKIEVSGESPRRAFLELFLSRGDRLLAEKIPEVLAQGGNFVSWRRVFEALKRDFEEWPRCPWGGSIRPWSMVSH